jgi:translocation and assembly module TamB
VAGRTGSGNAPEVFTVGKRLTKDLYVSYQHSLADAEATLRFTYNVTQKLQLLLRASNRPGFDAVYRFTFDR